LVGIDLGKTTFHLAALGDNCKVLLKKKFTQKQLITFTANLETSLIGMEACSGAHFLGRALRAQGHGVKLIPAQFVKPFVKSNKNDFLDAEAIAEAVDRHNMRFVPIKTDDQLDLQATARRPRRSLPPVPFAPHENSDSGRCFAQARKTRWWAMWFDRYPGGSYAPHQLCKNTQTHIYPTSD
jgi:hypothetical protein